MQTPQNIRVHREDRILELVWSETKTSRLPFRSIRQDCRCAACVDEFSGRQILNRDAVPETIAADEVSLTGNYALKIRWSDGHDSGLFTWDHLRSLSDRVAAESSAS
ncbi:MAG: DUF971 domain-containing protein [Planctomycetaceae bacterium]